MRRATALMRVRPSAPTTMAALHQAAQAAQTLEELGDLFGASIASAGFTTHFCFGVAEDGAVAPLFGDADILPIRSLQGCDEHAPLDLIAKAVRPGHLLLSVQSWHGEAMFVGLGGRRDPVDDALRASLLGRAEVFATYGLALLERERDIETNVGLGLDQRRCLAQILAGRRDPEIADMLGITPLAVRGHVSEAMDATGARSRAEVISFAARRGWLADLPREPDLLSATH
jgi:DNA-binding CsgD family transcriptional regulator